MNMKKVMATFFLMILTVVATACGENNGENFASLDLMHIPVINFQPAENFVDFVVDYALIETARIKAVSQGYLWALDWEKGSLIKSADQGYNWTHVYDFENEIQAVYFDNYGNLFVSTSKDRWSPMGTGEIFKSHDGGLTFRRVLELEAGAAIWWNIASFYGGLMFVSEYGFKGNEYEPNNARRIYRSKNFGETWEIMYDPGETFDLHHHRLLITSDGVVYQSIGDGKNARIIRSLDKGDTWEVVMRRFLPTGGIALDDRILWGLDGGPWMGVALYDRATQQMTNVFDGYPIFNGPIYDMIYTGGVVYAIMLSYFGDTAPAGIFYSIDHGNTWNILGRINKTVDWGAGLTIIVADDDFIYINAGVPVYRNGEPSRFIGTIRLATVN